MAASGTIHEEQRLGVLDGLRGIAVLLVLWYHVWEISWLSAQPNSLEFLPETGFVGVLLFFFLSGFVITYPFERGVRGQGRMPTWGHFAWRRFTKIMPSYVLSIVVAYAIGYAQKQPDASPLPDVTTHLLFIHTWFLDRYGTINGVLWTLAVEVEFYCVFPLVWWGFRRQPWLVAGAMIAIAWAWRVWQYTCCYGTTFGSYEENLPGYLDIFAFGMLSAYLFVRFGDRIRTTAAKYAAPVLAIAGIVMAVVLLKNLYDFRFVDSWAGVWQVHRRPLLGAAFALVALGSLWAPWRWKMLLSNPPLRFLATFSYNLYLYHQMVARELLARHIPPYIGNDIHDDPRAEVTYTYVAFAATIVQATIVTYLFERPLLRIPPPRRVRGEDGVLRWTWSLKRSEEAPLPKPPSRWVSSRSLRVRRSTARLRQFEEPPAIRRVPRSSKP
ncbi:MAG: acyltransferase [Candidatus Eremiobacteraeota bacterium]|nr:acyltransferase [Candidatus Eremiobacteraeota bacterium]